MIGFCEDDYTGDEGEPGDVSRPNTPCTVTVEVIERTLETPLQIKLTPGEGNATSKKVAFTALLMSYWLFTTLTDTSYKRLHVVFSCSSYTTQITYSNSMVIAIATYESSLTFLCGFNYPIRIPTGSWYRQNNYTASLDSNHAMAMLMLS